MPVIMSLKSFDVVSKTTHLKEGCWNPVNQGITTNFKRSREVGWTEVF